MEVLAGLRLGGAVLTEVDDLRPETGALGRVALGLDGLLADLELRLGLAVAEVPPLARVAHHAARLAAAPRAGRFWARSFESDAWGTAAELLRWRDLLVEA